jgi:hypothetical protein
MKDPKIILERGGYNNFKVIGEYPNEEKLRQATTLLLKLENYTVYYTRSWKDDDGYSYMDYGSHTDFFRYK